MVTLQAPTILRRVEGDISSVLPVSGPLLILPPTTSPSDPPVLAEASSRKAEKRGSRADPLWLPSVDAAAAAAAAAAGCEGVGVYHR